LEAAGLLVTLIALLCYVKAGPDDTRPLWLVAASVSATCTLFIKYSFGVSMVGTVVLTEALNVLATKRLPSRRRVIYLAGPFVLLTCIWFADPNKLYRFWLYGQSQKDNQVVFWSVSNLLYYPNSLIRYYAAGPLSLTLILIGLVTSLFAWRQHGFRAVGIYLLFGMVMLTLVPQKIVRFTYTVAPAAFVLAGPPAGQAIAWLISLERRRWLWPIAALLSASLLIIEAKAVVRRFSFYDPAVEIALLSSPDERQAYHFIADNTLARGIRPHILNFWHLMNNYALEWEYYANSGGEPAAYNYQISTVSLAPEPTSSNLNALVQRLRQHGPYALISIDGSPAGNYTGWQVIEPLLVRGELETHPDHPFYMITEWPAPYVDKVFASDFSSRDEFEKARRESKVEYPIQIHLYYLKP
jgi:hypothetical protein